MEISLSSPIDQKAPFSVDVYFVAENDRSVYYPSKQIDTSYYYGDKVKYITSDLVNGPNINMTWQWSNATSA